MALELGCTGQGQGTVPEEVGITPDLVALNSCRLLHAISCDLGLLDLISLSALVGSCIVITPVYLDSDSTIPVASGKGNATYPLE